MEPKYDLFLLMLNYIIIVEMYRLSLHNRELEMLVICQSNLFEKHQRSEI